MRILFTIPHHVKPCGEGFYGSERSATKRVESLTRCLSALQRNFGRKKQGFLSGREQQILLADETVGHDIEVIVCTTGYDHLLETISPGLFCRHTTKAQPRLLGYECHEVMREGLNRFDFFCYLEDDIFLGDALLFQKLIWFNKMTGDKSLLQPNRFEVTQKQPTHKFYIDGDLVDPMLSAQFQDRSQDPEIRAMLMGMELVFRRIDNPHAGCFFLNAAQLKKWTTMPYFLDRSSAFWGPMESAATLGIMRTFQVYKPARENAAFLEVEHLDSRYEIFERSSTQVDVPVLTYSRKGNSRVKSAEGLFQTVEILSHIPPYSRGIVADLGLQGLHFGCGRNIQVGWLNTDILCLTDTKGNSTVFDRLALLDGCYYYLQHDSTQPFPFEVESFDWIYSEHFIEHLMLKEAVAWLKECRRLLAKGGCIRLSTPDLQRYIQGYFSDQDCFFEEHRKRLRKMGMKWVPESRAWMVNQIFQGWGHKWIYDLDEIKFVASMAGFNRKNVVQCGFQSGRISEVFALDSPQRNDESIYVEIGIEIDST